MSGTDLFENIYTGTDSLTLTTTETLTNITTPTVTLTHNVSPTSNVSNGDTVTVTATFSEAMQATPTINISGGQATYVAMSATASSAIWTYNWTVSSTVSTEVSVTVSGTDLAGIAYSGTDSLTFNIAVRPDYLPTNGLMAWYPFNGNATDESGNGNNATIHGPSLTTDRENNVNSSFVFNGTDYLLVEGDESLESNELTISLWANASSLILLTDYQHHGIQ